MHAWAGHLNDLAQLALPSHEKPTPAAAERRLARKSRRDPAGESGASESESGTEWATTASTEPPHPPPPALVVAAARAARPPSAAEGLLSLFGAKPPSSKVLTLEANASGQSPQAGLGAPPGGPRPRSGSEQLHSPGSPGTSNGGAALAAVSWVSAYFADRVAAQQEVRRKTVVWFACC